MIQVARAISSIIPTWSIAMLREHPPAKQVDTNDSNSSSNTPTWTITSLRSHRFPQPTRLISRIEHVVALHQMTPPHCCARAASACQANWLKILTWFERYLRLSITLLCSHRSPGQANWTNDSDDFSTAQAETTTLLASTQCSQAMEGL